jgi:hypothetical protein
MGSQGPSTPARLGKKLKAGPLRRHPGSACAPRCQPGGGLAAVMLLLLEGWHHCFGQELQAPVYGFRGEQAAGIEFGGEAGQAEHVLELDQAVNDALRTADNYLGVQDVFIGEFLELFDTSLPPLPDF